MKTKPNLLSIIGPGILVAATGVGAGDLATAAFTGSKLGLVILWAVLLGAFFKFVLNEGLARWQLASGYTILEGVTHHFGSLILYGFLLYFFLWSFMVAAALMSACGVAAHAIFPLTSDPVTGKIIYGIIHSLIGLGLVQLGGYHLFEKMMGICIVLMFITVMTTAIFLQPNFTEVINGLVIPTIPQNNWEGLAWTIALIGGIGGTVTILSYGYWIQEENRLTLKDLWLCRLDLAIGYLVTALFGIFMVIIGYQIQTEGSGALLIIKLADMLVEEMGPVGKWLFLIGAWGAIFSSLLGVWQSVPYIFADLWRLLRNGDNTYKLTTSSDSKSYYIYLYALAFIPMLGLWVGFANMQKFYAIIGALFIPMLAITLLLLNKSPLIENKHRNHPITTGILGLILLFFVMAGGLTLKKVVGL